MDFLPKLRSDDIPESESPETDHEDKTVNLFYLRDLLMKTDPYNLLTLDKLQAIAKLKRNCHLPVFKVAIEPILTPDLPN
jgi:hypothetical protein